MTMPHQSLIALVLVLWSSLLVAQDQDSLVTEKKPDLGKTARLIVEGTNTFRRDQGRAELKTSPRLEATARDFAAFMARTDKYGHDADGNQPEDRAKKHGYDYCIVAENIAYEFNSDGFATADLARAFVEGWKRSPGHRKNMLDADLTGAGRGRGPQREVGQVLRGPGVRPAEVGEIEFRIVNEAGSSRSSTSSATRHQTLEPDHADPRLCRPTN